MASPEKSLLVKDIEFRIYEETKYIESLKKAFMREIQDKALDTRRVRFSELMYDESIATLSKVASANEHNPVVQEFHAQIERIYRFRLENAEKDSLTEMGHSTLALNSDIFGNILDRNPHYKDHLVPFYKRALPGPFRRVVWKALLRNVPAEEEYLDIRQKNRWKTISHNEVDIAQKCVSILTKLTPSLAYNGKLINALRESLGYIEQVIHRRLPEFMYYIIVPLVYTVSDTLHDLPRMIGTFMRMAEIQASVWHQSSEADVVELFLGALQSLDEQLFQLLHSLLDLQLMTHKEKLRNFIKPFISRLSVGYLNIESSCCLFDQLILNNSQDKIFYLFAIVLISLRTELLGTNSWDEFVKSFILFAKKIKVRTVEKLLHLVPEGEDLERKEQVPEHLMGQEYLDHVMDAYELATDAQKHSLEGVGGIYSVQRLIANNPFMAVKYQKALRGNLLAQMLGNDRTTQNEGLVLGRKPTLLRKNTLMSTNVQNMGQSIYRQLTKDLEPSESFSLSRKTKDFQRGGTKDLSHVLEESDSLPHKALLGDLSGISQYDISDASGVEPKLPLFTADKSGILNLNKPEKPRRKSVKLDPAFLEEGQRPVIIDNTQGTRVKTLAQAQEEKKKTQPLLGSQVAPNVRDSHLPPPAVNYLAAGLLGVPDLSRLESSIFDEFDDL